MFVLGCEIVRYFFSMWTTPSHRSSGGFLPVLLAKPYIQERWPVFSTIFEALMEFSIASSQDCLLKAPMASAKIAQAQTGVFLDIEREIERAYHQPNTPMREPKNIALNRRDLMRLLLVSQPFIKKCCYRRYLHLQCYKRFSQNKS
jgi:hypothetical protein